MSLPKRISAALRAGARVVILRDGDELLATEAAKVACGIRNCKCGWTGVTDKPACPECGERITNPNPVTVRGGGAADVFDLIADWPTRPNAGTLIVGGFLDLYGTNPQALRNVREVALRASVGKPSRLILVEGPWTQVPTSIAGDCELIQSPLPNAAELLSELRGFSAEERIEIPSDDLAAELVGAVAGLPRHEACRLFARSWIELKKLDGGWLRTEKARKVAERLGGALQFVDSAGPDVGGLDQLLGWLRERKAAFASPKAKAFGLPEPKGLLLVGVPGCGKSLTARAVAREWNLPLLRLDAGKLFGSLVGQSEAQTRQAIEAAEACAPCVLFVDEIEKGLSSGSGSSDGGTSQRVFGALLTWLQEKTAPVFVLATANRVAGLPPELLRRGRFDSIFFVGLPTTGEREAILAVHAKRRACDFDVKQVAEATEGFSGAELEQTMIDGMFAAFAAGRPTNTQDVLEAAVRTVPLSRTMADEVAALTKWAEGRATPASTPPKTTTGRGRGARLEAGGLN